MWKRQDHGFACVAKGFLALDGDEMFLFCVEAKGFLFLREFCVCVVHGRVARDSRVASFHGRPRGVDMRAGIHLPVVCQIWQVRATQFPGISRARVFADQQKIVAMGQTFRIVQLGWHPAVRGFASHQSGCFSPGGKNSCEVR